MQEYAGIYLLQNHSLHVSGVQRTHHRLQFYVLLMMGAMETRNM